MAHGDIILCDATGFESGDPQECAWPRPPTLVGLGDPNSKRLEVVLNAANARTGNYYGRVPAGEDRSGGIFGPRWQSGNSGYLFGLGFRVASFATPGTGRRPLGGLYFRSGGVNVSKLRFYVSEDGKLWAYSDAFTGGLEVAGAGAVTAGTWHYLEIAAGYDPEAGFRLELDGAALTDVEDDQAHEPPDYCVVGALVTTDAGAETTPYEMWYDDLVCLGRESSGGEIHGGGTSVPGAYVPFVGGMAVGTPQDPSTWVLNAAPAMTGEPGTDCDEWPGAADGRTTVIRSTGSGGRQVAHLSAAGSVPAGATILGGAFYGLYAGTEGVAAELLERGDAAGSGIAYDDGDTGYAVWARFAAGQRYNDGAAMTEAAFDSFDARFDLPSGGEVTALLWNLVYERTGSGGGGAPIAPSGLSAAAVDTDTLQLSWNDNSVDETSFRVERSANGTSGWAEIGSSAANTPAYTDNGLAATTTYYYRVRARNATGDSAYSNVANATTTGGGTVPAAASDLTATAVSASRIRLGWRDNATDETGFKVERSPDGTSGWVEIGRVEDNVTAFQNTGLAAATLFYYRVRAFNLSGDSVYSNAASATTLAAGVGECAVTPYATVADVQGRIWTDLLAIADDTQPSRATVEDWLCQESHWMDSTFAWRYVMPATDPEDRERLRPACADLVAGRAWRVLVPRNPGQEKRPEELRGSGLISLVYQPSAVRPVGSSLGRLATDPPREGRSFLVLPNTRFRRMKRGGTRGAGGELHGTDRERRSESDARAAILRSW